MEPSDPTAGSMRPSSVPSWMSELKGQPGVPALPPRQRAAHLIDGAAPTGRPRAPIVTQKTQATKPAGGRGAAAHLPRRSGRRRGR